MTDYQRYRDAVTMVAEVFSGAPQAADKSMPHVEKQNTGIGVSAQRQGGVGAAHKVVTRQLMEGEA